MLKQLSTRFAGCLRQSTFTQIATRNYGSLFNFKLQIEKVTFILTFVFYDAVTAAKRFYKQTGVLYAGDGTYEISLDNRKLKTPHGTPLVVRSEALAIALAAEWDLQKDTIDRSNMHLVI